MADQMHLPEGTVSLLFTDVEGSTDLRTREGDDVAQEMLRAHEALLRSQIEEHGGQEVVFMGDGFMIAFASTRRALACAVGIQRAFAEHNLEHPERPIKVRAGINTGEVTAEQGTLYGTAVNAAARIMGKADGGQIFVSQLVKDLTTGVREFVFVDRGEHELKGFPEPWRLYEVRWADDDAEPAPAPTTAAPASPPLAQQAIEGAAPPPAFELIGRQTERAAIEEILAEAEAGRIRVLSLEGEAGIGKTRLMEEAGQAARARGFGVVVVGGDEELSGPFLLLRTLLASQEMQALAAATGAGDRLEDARRELAGGGAGPDEGRRASEQMLHVYDVVTTVIRAISAERPMLLVLDDLQWADEDSVKLVRYLVRTSSSLRLVIMLAIRWEVEPARKAASTLVADLERMQLARRMRLERFTRAETSALLEQVLGAPVGSEAAGTLHARGEGVPFFVVEFARAYREARMLQLVQGTWEISKTARQTVPTSVQILIERRLAQLPEDTQAALSDAAAIGRRVRVAEVAAVCSSIGEPRDEAGVAELLEPAVRHSLLAPAGNDADLVFTHDQIRSALVEGLPKERRRAIHRALVDRVAERAGLDLEAERWDAAPGVLSTVAHHALAAGEQELGIRASIAAAGAALEAHAPEEAIRLVEAASAAASEPGDRAALLRIRDDALAVLERGSERAPLLAELAALASALGDPAIELDVTLRRSSAALIGEEYEQAADLARQALERAEGREDELRAALALGQALLQTGIGETYMPSSDEVDLDGAEGAFARAAELATDLEDERGYAAARRELGVVANGRAHKRMSALVAEGRQMEAPADPEINEHFGRARVHFEEAVKVCERTGDRRCEMSSLIGMAYTHLAQETQHGHAGRIEQIRRLMQRLSGLTSETERAESELHMLYSILLYAVMHGHVDLALARGVEAYGAARARGAHRFVFLSAGGLVEAHLQVGELAEAAVWLGKAEEASLAADSPLSERQLETWRAFVREAEGDQVAMREHLERAAAVARSVGSQAGRCEAYAHLAIKSALLASEEASEPALEDAERAATEALNIAEVLPGADPWAAKAHAARALAAHLRGDAPAAGEAAREALAAEHEARHLFKITDLDLWLAVGIVLRAADDPQALGFRSEVGLLLLFTAFSIADEGARERWLAGTKQSRILESIGGLPDPPFEVDEEALATKPVLGDAEATALRGITAGLTVEEIAAGHDLEAAEVERALASAFEKLGATSANQAQARAMEVGIA